jgi:membrane protease YdiL (CAAX protease family)
MTRELSPITLEARRRLSRIFFGFFLFFVLALGGQIALQVAVLILAPSLSNTPLYTWVLSLLPMYGIGLPALYLTVRHLPVCEPTRRRLRVRDFLTFLLMAYATMYLANLLGTGINLLTDLFLGHSSSAGATEIITGSPIGYTVLFAVVIGPAVEELIFRKILLRRLLPFGEGFALFTSSLLFGLYHANLAQFIYAFAVGWILGIVAVRTGKLIHTVLLHILINFLGTVPASLLLPAIEAHFPEGEEAVMTQEAVLAMLALFAYLAFLFLIVGAGVILLFLRRRALRPLPSTVVIPREERRYLPLSLGAAAYLLMLIYLFVNSYL